MKIKFIWYAVFISIFFTSCSKQAIEATLIPVPTATLTQPTPTTMPTSIPEPETEQKDHLTEVIPISEMANQIPWLEMDSSAIPVTGFIGINLNTPPFNNVLVRKAFSLAIDRQKIAKLEESHENESTFPATTFIPPQTLGVDLYGIVGLNFNPEKAKQSLIDAGCSDPSQLPEIQLAFYEENADNANAYIDMWKSALGVDVIPVPLKTNELFNYVANQKPGLFMMWWGADYNDPNNFTYDAFIDPKSSIILLANPEISNLIEEAKTSLDNPLDRQELYIEIEKLLTEEEIFVIPITHEIANRS